MSEKYLKVSELNNLIKEVLTGSLPQAIWVCGEIQGYNRNRSKPHVFFELVEKDPKSKSITARIGLVVFANRKFHIEHILKRSENAFELKDDIEVKFACKVDFYAPHGAVRLIVESIDPTYTLGKLAQEKQKLIALLQKKGVLDQNKQKELAVVPLNIGLITSDDSAAHNDFYSELKRSSLSFKIYLRNAVMQGQKTEGDVCNAINELERIKDLDAIIITRGGGSIADLSYFDSQLIAQRIADCRIPILTGIGHEINLTIADLAAHTFAKTPTAIAQFLVQRIEDFLGLMDEKMERIIIKAREKIEGEKVYLKEVALNLQRGTMYFLKDHNEKVIRVEEFMKSRPIILLKSYQQKIKLAQDQVLQVIKRRLGGEQIKLRNIEKIITIVHPVNTLKRGFSIARRTDGKIIRSVKDVKENEEMITEMVDGSIESIVKKIEGEE